MRPKRQAQREALGIRLTTTDPAKEKHEGLSQLRAEGALKGRSTIETVFWVLKDRLGLVTSLPRSLDSYLTHYILVFLAYQLARRGTHALGTPALPIP